MDSEHYPIILVSENTGQQEKYIKEFITQHKISPYYTYHILPEKTELGIDQIREIKSKINESVGMNTRLFIFETFNSASVEAQNALLKTLEESTKYNYFILITKELEKILPTIQSRSQIVILDNPSERHATESTINELKELFDTVKTASDYSFLSSPLVNKLTKEQSITFLMNLIVVIKQKYTSGDQRLVTITKKILTVKKLIENNNLNTNLAIDNLLIFIHKLYKMKLDR